MRTSRVSIKKDQLREPRLQRLLPSSNEWKGIVVHLVRSQAKQVIRPNCEYQSTHRFRRPAKPWRAMREVNYFQRNLHHDQYLALDRGNDKDECES